VDEPVSTSKYVYEKPKENVNPTIVRGLKIIYSTEDRIKSVIAEINQQELIIKQMKTNLVAAENKKTELNSELENLKKLKQEEEENELSVQQLRKLLGDDGYLLKFKDLSKSLSLLLKKKEKDHKKTLLEVCRDFCGDIYSEGDSDPEASNVHKEAETTIVSSSDDSPSDSDESIDIKSSRTKIRDGTYIYYVESKLKKK